VLYINAAAEYDRLKNIIRCCTYYWFIQLYSCRQKKNREHAH